ncbi:TetR/AcrR family transcriptional regulator [Nonomuraea candida]|uniref:TetR/AcrR family transcriptional regulator n=1 Tax=Nonomuraea candida TaxID=359159 RepID=UPI0005BE7E66|nr:TetR/AcrR family transcriptional regulator [Nonomuraea candida]
MVGRPRSETSRRAILRAALDLCERDGYQNVTLKGIAQAAGTGRQTVYRWWRTKAEVMIEALTVFVEAPTGSEDLRTFLLETFRLSGGAAGGVVVGLMADAQSDEAFAVRMRGFIDSRRRALRAVLARTLSADVDLELAVDMVFGAMWYRLMNRHAPVDESLADDVTAMLARLSS